MRVFLNISSGCWSAQFNVIYISQKNTPSINAAGCSLTFPKLGYLWCTVSPSGKALNSSTSVSFQSSVQVLLCAYLKMVISYYNPIPEEKGKNQSSAC